MSTLLLSSNPLHSNRWTNSDSDPMPVIAGVLTFAVHVVFAAVLLLNMNWQQPVQPHSTVKLWESMPTTTTSPAKKVVKPTKSDPAPPPEPVAQPIAPKPAATQPAPPPPQKIDVVQPAPPAFTPPAAELTAPVRDTISQPEPVTINPVEIEPPPSVSPAPLKEQPAPQPDIDIVELKRQRALALAQLLREEESARLDDTIDQEREARIVEYKRRLEERERKLARELNQIQTATQRRHDEQLAQTAREAAARQQTDDYRARISAKIRQRVILPPDLQGNPQAMYEVSLLPGGEVTQVRLLQTSGVATYDAAVERAILAAQPLPVPEESGLFQANFKNLLLSFRPKE